MKQRQNAGFTLVELMITLVIIGICAAIVAPQLVSHKRSSDLTDLTNMVQQTAIQARSLALQTRRAAVLEVSGTEDKVWINALSGPRCWDGIQQTCVQSTGHTDDVAEFSLTEEPYASAGTAFCDAQAMIVTDPGKESASCGLADGLSATSDFALCYSGSGELFVRPAADAGAACDDGVASADATAWFRACAAVGGEADLNGAVLRFNRFEDGAGSCGDPDGGVSGAVDVTRAVYLPTGGAPYSRVDI